MLSPSKIYRGKPVLQAYTRDVHGDDRVSLLQFIETWTSPAGNVFDLPTPAAWNRWFNREALRIIELSKLGRQLGRIPINRQGQASKLSERANSSGMGERLGDRFDHSNPIRNTKYLPKANQDSLDNHAPTLTGPSSCDSCVSYP